MLRLRALKAVTILAIVLSTLAVAQAQANAPSRSLFPMRRPAFIEARAPSVAPSATPSAAEQRGQGGISSTRVSTPTDQAVARALVGGGSGQGATDGPGVVARSLLPRARPRNLARRAVTRVAQAPVAGAAAAPTREPGRLRRALSRVFGGGDRDRSRGAPSEPSDIETGICGSRALQGRRLPAITSTRAGCGIAEPVALTQVHGIPLSRPARLDCRVAIAFARWVDEAMVPAVGRRGGGIAEISMVGDYSCRTRNHRPGARLSEHARGMAIDIAGYRLNNGDRVTLLNDWRRRPHRSDLREMHEHACGIFRTTLSPNSDRHHQDHFHFDLADHRGGGTYCR